MDQRELFPLEPNGPRTVTLSELLSELCRIFGVECIEVHDVTPAEEADPSTTAAFKE
jgi:hypothetical protein